MTDNTVDAKTLELYARKLCELEGLNPDEHIYGDIMWKTKVVAIKQHLDICNAIYIVDNEIFNAGTEPKLTLTDFKRWVESHNPQHNWDWTDLLGIESMLKQCVAYSGTLEISELVDMFETSK